MESRLLHVVSWNVAGFRTTYERIRSKWGGLEMFMDKLRIDVLCLQEVKMGEDQLTFESIEQNSASLECFFAWSGKKSGVNGVATIARKGLTRGATRFLGGGPLSAPHDSTGRFVQTDHGDFVLINVYVHNDGDEGVNVSVKMDFLLCVRQRVQQLQAQGRRVIVAGDLNLKLRPFDSCWQHRSIDLMALRKSHPEHSEPSLLSKLRALLAREENWKLFIDKMGRIEESESRSRFIYKIDGKKLKS